MKPMYIFGKWVEVKEISTDFMIEVCEQAETRKKSIADFPFHKIWKLLKALSQKWQDPNYDRRQRMQKVLPKETGFSGPMISLALEELANELHPDGLKTKVKTEFAGIPRGIDAKVEPESGRLLRWHPLGSVLHVLSGNVFLTGVGSFLEGLLTGNVSILKMSSGETVFMPEFIESLQEVERECNLEPIVSQSIALIHFPKQAKEVIEVFQKNCAGIVVWGGEAAVATYRNGLPARCRMVVFGPKLSLGWITASGIATQPLSQTAEAIADELAIWDQNACTAPQVLFVEGRKNAEALVPFLHKAMQDKAQQLPQGSLDPNTAAEIQKLRAVNEMAAIRENTTVVHSSGDLAFTLYLTDDPTLETSPLNRTLKIVALEAREDLLKQIAALQAYVQTVGLLSSDTEFAQLSYELGELGVLRIMELGKMSGGAVDDPHDGAYDLPQLMNLVVSRKKQKEPGRSFSYLGKREQDQLIKQRICETLEIARQHPLYAESISVSTEDLTDWPILEKETFFHWSDKEFIGTGGSVTRSGGTTQKICYSYFDESDWQEMIAYGAEAYADLGFTASDRMANLFAAGGLYGSFLTFQECNEKLGLTSFPFTSSFSEVDDFITIWNKFRFNCAQGTPSAMVPFLRKVKESCPEFALEKIMYAGTPLSGADQAWLEEELGVELIASLIGTSEAGLIAYSSNQYPEGHFRMLPEYNYIEIVDSEGNPLPLGEKGDLAITALQKNSLPVVRFRIGDCGRIKRDKEGQLWLQYMGRSDSILCIGGMNLSRPEILNALSHLDISALQVVGSFNNEIERLGIYFESTQADLQAKVEKILLDQIPDMQLHLDAGYYQLEIKQFPVGGIPRNSVTGKLKEMIDNRILTS